MPDDSGGDERLSVGNGGWIRWRRDHLDAYVRVEDREGRLRPVDLFMPARNVLTTDALREVPLGRVEAWINDPDVAPQVRELLHEEGPELRDALEAQLSAASASLMLLRGEELESVRQADERELWAELGVVSLRIEAPAGRSYPDAFYDAVARAYSHLARTGRGPAVRLAEINGVPTSTVHRWVKECRRRGLLAPGQAGKAG